MNPGDLRRFKDDLNGPGNDFDGCTFLVLKVNTSWWGGVAKTVDILLDGRIEEDMGYRWVESSAEVLNEAR